MMKSRAYVETDLQMMGVKLAVLRGEPPHSQIVTWEQPNVVRLDEDLAASPPEATWLRLHEDDARAIYEALADYFGHTGHDIRALRRDYESERGRVDKLIDHITKKVFS